MAIAINRLATSPERYPFRMMASAVEADMLTVLLAKLEDQSEALSLLAGQSASP